MDVFPAQSKESIHFDVVVAGSGSAGATAAIAAARAGAKTLLVERFGFLGGTSTAVLDTFYGFFTPGTRSIKVVGGVADDVVKGLREYNACMERPNTYGAGTGVTYNSEYLKVVWERLVQDAGAAVLLYAWVQEASVSEEKIQSLTVATKQGLRKVTGKYFVDATGDADLSYFAGAPCEIAGEHEPAQMLTTTFKIANVDVPLRKSMSKQEFHKRMEAAAESGRYRLPRREGSDHVTPVKGMMATNMTRVQSFDSSGGRLRNATDPDLLTSAEIEGRRQALEYLRFLKTEISGYANADLIAFGTQIGVRETRRVQGEYRLTREDVLAARQFDDQVGLCGAPIEDHHAGSDTQWQYLPDGQCVGIPLRALIPRKIENLLVSGRCFSATHDAHASVRSMAQCMAMGQAAGTAAALCAASRRAPRDLDFRLLEQALLKAGAILRLQ
ncbi:MAG TPA: FAD-dependent oxidoreductase [Verrucomicrobiae bacterium]|nr:FAD-dependent oxidoreductase [Verrucomicrobiae bacterium]